ncbi:MAG: glutamate 5-kinase [Alphaproteobacteria bacterium]|jgi:glutamate 5-kinase|nr:glutamate 5-kinase [Alphaproteobacteria bacterium]
MNTPLVSARRIVVKTGSALIAEAGSARHDWLERLARDIAELRESGREVVLVTSGAIALGRGALGASSAGRLRLEEKQAAAAFGQPYLMGALETVFAPHGIRVAQSLLTLSDTENRRRWLNARATLETLLAAGGLPVINENDTVATDEIRYGDNDRLAARAAQMLSADCLILLSDVDGLYTADPRLDPSACHIRELSQLGEEHIAMAGGANAESGLGSGGMATKLAAARIAYAAGCATAITAGNRQAPLRALADGARATWILPPLSPARARETWLAGHLSPEGTLVIDDGAVNALAGGASLLPVGVCDVAGRFERGAAVEVTDRTGRPVAKGVTAYGSADIARIAGRRSEEVETLLGWRGRPAIIHRDDLVFTGPRS